MKRLFIWMLLFVSIAVGRTSNADQRNYVWTYEYLTLNKGSTEFEYYLTSKTPDDSRSGDTDYQHQLELEYGITDRWDIALYQVFNQPDGESLKYGGFKVRTRYRFGERGEFFVDPLMYLEYQSRVDDADVFETKVILSKDIGKLNISYNQIIETEFDSDGEVEHEYAFGVSGPLSAALSLGMESKGNFTVGQYTAGPTLSWVGGRVWANLGVLFGFNEKAPDLQTRFILGIPF
jgi:hypothetical protein